MILRMFPSMIPVELYPYETAHAKNSICIDPDSDALYSSVYKLVDKYFGKDRMDNKITMKFQHLDSPSSVLYVTWWDGRLYIGNEVNFFERHK